jgi:hypothetical protein
MCGKAEDLDIFDKYEELALNGIMSIDDDIVKDNYVPYDKLDFLLDDINNSSCQDPEMKKYKIDVLWKFVRGLSIRKIDYESANDLIDEWAALVISIFIQYNLIILSKEARGLLDDNPSLAAILVKRTLNQFFYHLY